MDKVENMGITVSPRVFAQNIILGGNVASLCTLDVEAALAQGMRATFLHEVLLNLVHMGISVDTAALEWVEAAAA